MAWVTKYLMEFKDMAGSNCSAAFQEDGFAGSVTNLTPGATPMKLRYNSKGKYDPIVGTEMEFQVVYQTELEDLYVEEDRVIRVYVNGPLSNDWYGYLTPFQSRRMMGEIPHYATFIATDQLGALKNMKFRDGSDDPYFYVSTDLANLERILDKTGLALPFYENINIYADGFDETAADSPLDQTYFYPEMYWDDTTDESGDCYTVLYDMLKKYGARLFQRDYSWHISRPNTMWSIHTRRLFTAVYAYLSNTTSSFLWNVADEGGVWRARPEIYKNPRAGRVEITTTTPRKDNLVKNSTLDDFTQNGSSFPYYWDTDSTPAASVSDGFFTLGDNDSSSLPAQGIYCEVRFTDLSAFDIVIQFQAVYSGGTTCVLHFGISATDESNWWNPATQAWQPTEVHYEYDVEAELGGTMGATQDIDESAFLTIPVKTSPGVNAGVKFNVLEIFNDGDSTSAVVHIYDVRIEPTYITSGVEEEVVTVENTAVSNHIITDDLRQCEHFRAVSDWDDLFDTLRDGVALDDLTNFWDIVGDPTADSSIQALLARQYLEGAYYPREVIRGTLRGYYDYHKALVEDGITDEYGYPKTFIPLDLTYDYRRMEWTGKWEEVGPIYTDEDIDWASHDYGGGLGASITDNEIDINTNPVSGTDTATSDIWACTAIGEMVRVHVNVVDAGSSDPPNYGIDGQSGTLEFGDNYLQFRMSATGNKTFVINHTDGERANCVVTIKFYSLIGL